MEVNTGHIQQETNKATEMRHLRAFKSRARRDHTLNGDIRKELKIQSLQNKTDGHRQHWMNHLCRMTDERMHKQTPQ
jgi:hypothetical protein